MTNNMSNNSSLDEYRIVVAAATYDELDKHDLERRISTIRKDLHLQSMASSVVSDSVDASTVDIDNTSPYLKRYAEIYAEENNNDASTTTTKAGPTFVNVKSSSTKYTEGDKVVYTGGKGEPGEEAIVTKIEYDDERNPHYTIKMTPSMEESSANGATDENGETPTNCRDFKTNSTSLFRSLYEGNWKEAGQCLANNPEEARIWIARYAKKESTAGESTDEGDDIRWQLLPLHLYIALGGRSTDDTGSVKTKAPPIELLNALLLAYPQATQCTDDQSMIPLHSAIRGDSSLAIIEKLLEIDAASVYKKDSRGRNVFVLAEKVYGKIHKQQVGSEDESRQLKYAHLMSLLSNAATRVATTKSQPKEKTQATGKKKTQPAPTQFQKVQIENLALRRENAMLHHRAEINGRLLQQLVEKLQMYEDQRSGIENYNEIFGSKDELDDRREEILTSISEDAGEDKNDEKEEKQKVHVLGGDGAYNKRLERDLYTTPIKSKDDNDLESPDTAATEPTTPFMLDNNGEHSDILSVSDCSQDQQQDIFRSKELNTGALIDTAEIPLDSSVVKVIDTANPNISIDSSESIEDLQKVTRGISAISPVLSFEEQEMLVVE